MTIALKIIKPETIFTRRKVSKTMVLDCRAKTQVEKLNECQQLYDRAPDLVARSPPEPLEKP